MLRRGLAGQLVDQLGRNIVRGDYPEGWALPNEFDLGLEYGVSRTVVREAIKTLAEKGLLSARPKVGTRVRARDRWNYLDADVLRWLYEVGPRDEFLHKLTETRALIEPGAAALAAQRATADEVAQIATYYEAMTRVVEERERYIEVDLQFHNSIAHAAHNELLEQIVRTIRMALITSRKITTQRAGSSQAALPLHYAVLAAIRAGSPAQARRAMEVLIERTAEDIEHVLAHSSSTQENE